MFRRVVAPLLALAPLAAQSTWVVDADGRPGAHFADLPAAVGAAQTGDTLLVRAASFPYTAFATDKGLRVLGVGDPVLYAPRWVPVVRVTNLPSTATFVIDGFHVPPESSFEVVLAANAGLVVLSHLRALESCNCGPGVMLPPGFAISDCAQVVVDSCENFGKPAIDVLRSEVAITRTRLGMNAIGVGWGNCLHVDGGRVDVAESELDASLAMDVLGNAQPAVRLRAGRLRVGATNASYVQGSTIRGMAFLQPAIEVGGGDLELDLDVRLNPFAGGGIPLRMLGGTLTVRQTAMAVVRSAAIGGVLSADAITTALAPVVLFAGLPIAPTPTAPFGTLWLDPSASLVLGFGTAPASGIVSGAIALPNGLPPGLIVSLQCVADLGAGLELSSPSLVTLR